MQANFETGLKICSTCKRELTFDHFVKCKSNKDGMNNQCKDCAKAMRNTDSYKEKRKGWIRKYKQSEKGKEAESRYRHSDTGRACIKKMNKKRYDSGKNAEYLRTKRLTDSNYTTKERLRNRIYYTLKGKNKSAHTLDLLGCTIEELRQHLESQFQEGMTWNNIGEWHIDHIVPCSYFDLSKEENQQICFNFRNLQPLWGKDNRSKSNKLPENYQEIINNIKKELGLCR